MDNRCRRSALTRKPLPSQPVVSKMRSQHLYRYRSVEFSVVPLQHNAHPAATDDLFDFVSPHPTEHFRMRRSRQKIQIR
jgi:hypothetical protein